jgi:hypothetical protein
MAGKLQQKALEEDNTVHSFLSAVLFLSQGHVS